jgi:hypothetical protein
VVLWYRPHGIWALTWCWVPHAHRLALRKHKTCRLQLSQTDKPCPCVSVSQHEKSRSSNQSQVHCSCDSTRGGRSLICVSADSLRSTTGSRAKSSCAPGLVNWRCQHISFSLSPTACGNPMPILCSLHCRAQPNSTTRPTACSSKYSPLGARIEERQNAPVHPALQARVARVVERARGRVERSGRKGNTSVSGQSRTRLALRAEKGRSD